MMTRMTDIDEKPELFFYEVRQVGEEVELALHGIIDEDTPMESFGVYLGSLHFNFREVTDINFFGLRKWIEFLRNLQAIAYYSECPPNIAKKLSRIPALLDNARVTSFYVQHYCHYCDEDTLVLVNIVDLMRVYGGGVIPMECEDCGKRNPLREDHLSPFFSLIR